MSEDILSQQYVNGERCSSPMLERMGDRLCVYDPRKSYPPQTSAPPPRPRPVQPYTGAFPPARQSDIRQSDIIERKDLYGRYNEPVAPNNAPHVMRPSPDSRKERRAAGRIPDVPPPRPEAPYRAGSAEPDEGGRLSARVIAVYALIVFAVLGIALLALNWQRPARGAPDIEPGPDTSAEAALSDYANAELLPQPQTDGADDDFPLAVTQVFSVTPYVVRRGDTVSGLAVRNNVSVDALVSLNGIGNARVLQEGMTIKIPNMDGLAYTIKATDKSYQQIAAHFAVPLQVILDANDIQNEVMNPGDVIFIPGARLEALEKSSLGDDFLWPIGDRKIISSYGWSVDSGIRHEGINLAAKSGTSVRAAMDGTVIKVGTNSLYGRYIILQHANGFETLYGNLNAFSIKENAFVYKGIKIAESGGAGRASVPHLHFGVYKNGKSVNPLDYLGK
jgi:murein DD-endopeptidase MepM/ murein hydrolase activator NlpD